MINDTYTADKGASGSLRMVGGKDERELAKNR